MRITKQQGAMISLLIIGFYTYLYYQFVESNTVALWLTLFFFVGALGHFVRRNEFGGDLRFFGARTGDFWNEGYCLVPSFLHVLHNFDIYLLWDLHEPESENSNVQVDHFQDQKQSSYRVNADVSIFWLNVDKFFSLILGWFVGVNKGKKKLLYQRLGFRIILIAVIAGWVCNYTSPKPQEAMSQDIVKNRLTALGSEIYLPKRYLPDGREIAPINRRMENGMPVYTPFIKQCVVIKPDQGGVIIATSRIKNLDYGQGESIQLIKEEQINGKWEGGWTTSTWGDVDLETRNYDDLLPQRKVIGVSPVLNATSEKKVCF